MPDDQQLQYHTIRDFSAGLIAPDSITNIQDKPFPGVAAAIGTGQCIGKREGGLHPLPKRQTAVTGLTLPAFPSGADAPSIGPKPVAFYAFGPITISGGSVHPDEIFYAREWVRSSDSKGRLQLYRIKAFTGAANDRDLLVDFTTAGTTQGQFWGMTGVMSRFDVAAPYAQPGIVCFATEWSEAGLGGSKHTYVFPDPTAPTAVGVATFLGLRAGQLIAHQNRIVLLEDINYAHGAAGAAVPTNEQISFTDPANSNTAIGTQHEVFVAEVANGYGAWGSISAGELFLVKHQGGAVVITGDINSPDVRRLPGVVSTGGSMYRAASTPNGLFYLTRDQGAFVWRGADTSTKISSMLADHMFAQSGISDLTINIKGTIEPWGTYVLFPGGLLYDTETNSWWSLAVSSNKAGDTRAYDWYSRSFFDQYLYALDSVGNAIDFYDNRVLAPDFTFISNAVAIPEAQDRMIDIKEVIVEASGLGTVTVSTISLPSNPSGSDSVTFNITDDYGHEKYMTRINARNSAFSFLIQSLGNAGGEAPTIHSITFGWNMAEHAAVS